MAILVLGRSAKVEVRNYGPYQNVLLTPRTATLTVNPDVLVNPPSFILTGAGFLCLMGGIFTSLSADILPLRII